MKSLHLSKGLIIKENNPCFFYIFLIFFLIFIFKIIKNSLELPDEIFENTNFFDITNNIKNETNNNNTNNTILLTNNINLKKDICYYNNNNNNSFLLKCNKDSFLYELDYLYHLKYSYKKAELIGKFLNSKPIKILNRTCFKGGRIIYKINNIKTLKCIEIFDDLNFYIPYKLKMHLMSINKRNVTLYLFNEFLIQPPYKNFLFYNNKILICNFKQINNTKNLQTVIEITWNNKKEEFLCLNDINLVELI